MKGRLKVDFYCMTQISESLIDAKKDASELPVATTLTFDQIGTAAKAADNEAVESVLVSIENAVVSDPQPKSKTGKTFCGFWIGKDENDKALLVVCKWKTTFSSYDTDKKIWTTKVKKGDKLNSISGIVEYSYSEYKIAPLGDAGIDWKK